MQRFLLPRRGRRVEAVTRRHIERLSQLDPKNARLDELKRRLARPLIAAPRVDRSMRAFCGSGVFDTGGSKQSAAEFMERA